VPAVRKRKERGKWGSIVEEKVKVKETRWELKAKQAFKTHWHSIRIRTSSNITA
jgi:hypothetical protein